MFTYFSVKKYTTKLVPLLEKRYKSKGPFTPSQVRATVYQCDFNEKYLALGYLIALPKSEVKAIFSAEFSDICPEQYRIEIIELLANKKVCTKQLNISFS